MAPAKSSSFRFFADAMCGKLARWLRILGCDTLYRGGHGAEQISEKSQLAAVVEDNRILLTRNKRFSINESTLLLKADDVKGQIQEMVAKLGQPFLAELAKCRSRCGLCNGKLIKHYSPKDVTTSNQPHLDTALWLELPEGIQKIQEEFWLCKTCAKIYWKGSHWIEIDALRKTVLANSFKNR